MEIIRTGRRVLWSCAIRILWGCVILAAPLPFLAAGYWLIVLHGHGPIWLFGGYASYPHGFEYTDGILPSSLFAPLASGLIAILSAATFLWALKVSRPAPYNMWWRLFLCMIIAGFLFAVAGILAVLGLATEAGQLATVFEESTTWSSFHFDSGDPLIWSSSFVMKYFMFPLRFITESGFVVLFGLFASLLGLLAAYVVGPPNRATLAR